MSHTLSYKDDSGIWLNNANVADLIENLLRRAKNGPTSSDQREDIERFGQLWENGSLWPGRCLAVDVPEGTLGRSLT